ncbi:MAG: HAD family hydrolase [Proteobacteria bacterium]|nr:HAD family hydrolase [Pseudomonadota bacterium]
MIKTVSFDGDGTLWDFEKVMRGGLLKVLDEFRRILDDPRALEVGVDDLIRLRDEVAASHPGPVRNHERIRRASFAALLARFGIGDERLADRLSEIYFSHRFGVIELYDDAVATLEALAGRVRVGLTSNGNNYPARFGLADHFDFVLFSEECGFAKPDPRIYRETLRRGGCAPGEAIHVGDSLINDVQGAQAAGIHAIWLNRLAIPNDTTIRPDATISSLHQLPDLIG